jgi:hypothetical protein
MRKFNILILCFLLAVLSFSCSENNENPVNNTSETREFPDDTPQFSTGNDIRLPAAGLTTQLDKNESLTSEINPDDYEIIFSDYYKDNFYLNLKDQKNDYYYYTGVWSCHKGTFDATIIYHKGNKSVVLCAYYGHDHYLDDTGKGYDYVMYYHLNYVNDQYYNGMYGWLKINQQRYYKLSNMYIQLSKGNFPQ